MGVEERIIELLRERREDGILQSEISRMLGISKSTVSEVLQRLEGEGRVVRERVAGRSYRVWLSEYSPKPVRGVLRVGVLRASEYPHILLACMDTGSVVKVFDSAIELTRSLSFGSIDVGVSPFVTQTLFALTLRSIKIHCIVAYNGSGVAMKRDVKSCKVFATSELSAMESNLKLFLERIGVEVSGLKFKYFSSPDRMIEGFKGCEFDALAIWEPYFTKLRERYRCVEFREVIGDYPCCTLASNSGFLESRIKDVRRLISRIRRYAKGMDEEEASNVVSERMGFERELVLKSFESYKFCARMKLKDFRFLENYGIKLTEEFVKKIFQPI